MEKRESGGVRPTKLILPFKVSVYRKKKWGFSNVNALGRFRVVWEARGEGGEGEWYYERVDEIFQLLRTHESLKVKIG